MMFQQEYPYDFSLMKTSSIYEVLDYSIAEQHSHPTENLSSLQAQGGFSQEPPRKKRKRRRTRSEQKIEEKENQRMNHIAVERNRRRQMNHFLSILKAMMPLFYSRRVRLSLFTTHIYIAPISFSLIVICWVYKTSAKAKQFRYTDSVTSDNIKSMHAFRQVI